MHVAGSQNTAADFLSRLELTPKERVQLKLHDDILTAPIGVNLQSTDVADEEQLFFLPDEEEETEQGVFARKTLSKQRAIDEKEQQYLSTEIKKTETYHLMQQFMHLEQTKKMDEYVTNKIPTRS